MIIKKKVSRIKFTGNFFKLFALALILMLILNLFLIKSIINIERTGGWTSLKYFLTNFQIEQYLISLKNSFNTNIDTLYLNISQKNLDQLNYERKISQELGSLKFIDNKYVSSYIEILGKKIKAKVKLKGSTPSEHQAPEKFSIRIKLSDENYRGLREFSLMSPERRGFMREFIFRYMALKEDLIYKRLDFINLNLNGVNKGIYFLDEEFNKNLIENNAYRESALLKFDDSELWLQKAAIFLSPADWDQFYLTANIIEVKKGDKKNINFLKAKNNLNNFRKGNHTVSEVFDIEKYAKYFALVAVTGAWHGIISFNQTFYFNSITGKIEPIPDDLYTDGYKFNPHYNLKKFLEGDPFIKQFFNDDAFVKRFEKFYNIYSKNIYLDEFFDKNKSIFENALSIIRKSYPFYSFSKSEYYQAQEVINNYLNQDQLIKGYLLEERDDFLILNLKSESLFNFKAIAIKDNNNINLLDNKSGNDLFVYNRFSKKNNNFNINKKLLKDIDQTELYLEFLNNGKIEKKKINLINNNVINKKFNLRKSHLIKEVTINSSLNKVANIRDDVITFNKGELKINESIFIPYGFKVKAEPGTFITLSNDARIQTNSPVFFKGTKENPIIISSNGESLSGLDVINANSKSIIENTIFKQLNQSDITDYFVSLGAVSFYQSDVDIISSKFIDNKSEDALNVVRSEVNLKDLFFEGNISDAIDFDFTDGVISDSSFINTGNDSIDFSGSNVLLKNIFIEGSGDKGVSAGENSMINANSLIVKNSMIGIASKDNSTFELSNFQLDNNKIFAAAYQKKIEFGPSNIILKDCKVINEDKTLIEINSFLQCGNTILKGENKDVYKKLYF